MTITWATEKRKLKDLKPWRRNPRQITVDQAKRLIESFDEFGQVETIAIGPDNEVYNGHQRLGVLTHEHGENYEVEVRVASQELTERQREKLTIFLHKGAAGEWDWDTLANEFDFDDLKEWGFDDLEKVFEPGLHPSLTSSNHDEDDVTIAQGKLDNQYKKGQSLLFVMCPSCAEEFYVESSAIQGAKSD